MPDKRKIYKVTLKGNTEKNEVSVNYSPSQQPFSLEDRQILLNTLVGASHKAYLELLGNLPLLRPATDEERELSVYVFKDEQKDNALHKSRKALYDQLEGVFTTILEQLFPDVRYIQQADTHRQERVFEMNEEEAAAYKEEVNALVEKIRGEKDGD